MTPLEQDAADYELWLRIHNYAATTILCRHRYLAYFFAFAVERHVDCREGVTLELLLAYQRDLYLASATGYPSVSAPRRSACSRCASSAPGSGGKATSSTTRPPTC